MNPFAEMAKQHPREAFDLARAFTNAHTESDVWAVVRYLGLGGYLGGKYFPDISDCEIRNLQGLSDLAAEYLSA